MRRVLLLSALLMTTLGFAQGAPKCEELVHKALDTYGCLQSLRSFPAQTQQQISSQLSQDETMTDAEKATFMDAVVKAIDVDRLVKNVETQMATSCSTEDMKTVLANLNSATAQKMIKFEAASNSPTEAEKLRALLNSPDLKNASPKRTELVHRLIDATGASHAAVETIVQTTRAMMEGLGAKPASPEQVNEMRKQVQSITDENLFLMMLAVYHDASDDDLEKYVSMLETKPMRDFNTSFASAMVSGVALESRHAGVAVKDLAMKKRADNDKILHRDEKQ